MTIVDINRLNFEISFRSGCYLALDIFIYYTHEAV